MRNAIWLYLFLFIAFFDLHAQYPILTPFAISIGAAPSFIGLMMGMYSITHLPGNVIAGVAVDRLGSKGFIIFSLLGAGIILLLQAYVTDPWQLLLLRSISGFVIAFLSPACMALLAKMSNDLKQQGKLMAGHGLVHTIASVASPAAGAYLVAKIGFTTTFTFLGWLLVVTSLLAIFFIKDIKAPLSSSPAPIADAVPVVIKPKPKLQPEGTGIPWLIYLLPVGLSCAQGILSFEIPLLAKTTEAMMTTGLLFSIVSLGALVTLSLMFLNNLPAFQRTLWGAFSIAIVYFLIASEVAIPLTVLLFMVGLAKGVTLPALSTMLIELSGGVKYGRTFSILSIATSIGAFIGPVAAGALRNYVSPYYIAFLLLMTAITILPIIYSKHLRTAY
ncbi:MFS transporter [Paenibacillus yanchengensis]|uniref:MFS transporter n=1 Tax=Paenibacillus yanchengensis TaxID=2035833 RepID=A0ABW4YQC7_9BACL